MAKNLVRLKPAAMRGFAAELARARLGALEDLADVIVSLERQRESRRSYRRMPGKPGDVCVKKSAGPFLKVALPGRECKARI